MLSFFAPYCMCIYIASHPTTYVESGITGLVTIPSKTILQENFKFCKEFLNHARAWFLRIASVRECLYACVCVCVCVFPRGF